MLATTRTLRGFPNVSLPSCSGGLPIDVVLVAQLGHGAGDRLIERSLARQRGHDSYIDALDEPSARLGGIDLEKGDATSLYSFAVGAEGHPFHRHAGHRVFTAISGSAGTELRFSTASDAQIAADPRAFSDALQFVHIPPDCLFTVRFGGGTWHQFAPLHRRRRHPAMFALSCHTNELGGDLPDVVRQQVADNRADIPALTETLPPAVLDWLDGAEFDPAQVPTLALSLDTQATSWLAHVCGWVRGALGRAHGRLAGLRAPIGFLADNGGGRRVDALAEPPLDSLLRAQLPGAAAHQDTFATMSRPGEFADLPAAAVLAAILDGFLENRPFGVGRLMAFRNALVAPFGLRTSPLGCPVSSLLSETAGARFAGRFPVLAAQVDGDGRRAQVVLGADDKHLRFRSCVGVERLADGRVRCTLGTRVRTLNAFGRFYIAAIDRVHRGYVTPAMLRLAVDHAVRASRHTHAELPAPGLALPLRSAT